MCKVNSHIYHGEMRSIILQEDRSSFENNLIVIYQIIYYRSSTNLYERTILSECKLMPRRLHLNSRLFKAKPIVRKGRKVADPIYLESRTAEKVTALMSQKGF